MGSGASKKKAGQAQTATGTEVVTVTAVRPKKSAPKEETEEASAAPEAAGAVSGASSPAKAKDSPAAKPPVPKGRKDDDADSPSRKEASPIGSPAKHVENAGEEVEQAEVSAIKTKPTGISVEPAKPAPVVEQKAPVQRLKPEELPGACRAGEEAAIKAFLVAHAKGPNGLADCEEALFDEYGESVLHHAVHGGHLEVVHMLLELGRVQADIPNARNETSLQVACRRGDGHMIALLLKAEADPNRHDSSGSTPFLSAVFGGASEDLLGLLVKSGADTSCQDSRGVGALHFASLTENIQLMNFLVMHKADLDVQTEHGTTALMLASKRGFVMGVSLLLAAKANTNLSDEAGCSALMQSLSAGSIEVALKLLECGASVDTVDSAGRSALFHAVLGGDPSGLEAVIKRGGRVNILDEEGRSPLYQACLMGSKDLAKLLLNSGADPNLAGRGNAVRPQQPATEDGEEDSAAGRALLEEARTCLQVCSVLGHNELLVCMLEHGADINAAPGGLGWTTLHLCAAVCNDEGAALLLARGAVTSLQDAEGNTAEKLAERAGHSALVERLKEAAAAEPPPGEDGSSAPKSPQRRRDLKGQLPPLYAGNAEQEASGKEPDPLELFKEEWQERASDDSLLDRVFGPMVHDAMLCDQWRDRWEAHTFLAKNFAEVKGSPADLVGAVSEAISLAAMDKMPKVFQASLGILEELLADARVDDLSAEEFTSLLRSPDRGNDILVVLLDQTDAGGGSSNSTSPQQAAAGALCSCILHGRVPLDEAALPLLARIDQRMRTEQGKSKDKSEKAKAPKCLAANLKLLGRMLTAFGLQQSGIFRRALVLPLLLRTAASEHSKVRAAAGDCLLQLMALSGGIEERLWNLLPSKARKGVQSLASGHEGMTLLSAVPCEEDAMAKADIVAEDSRASGFVCVSELNPDVWAKLQAGEELKPRKLSKIGMGKSSRESLAAAPNENSSVVDDRAAEAFGKAFGSKDWKERAESIGKVSADIAAGGEGVKHLGENESADSGPLLSQYVLRGLRISTLQTQLAGLLSDTVTAVFVAAADLLRLVCSHVPLYIAPLFLEPLLPPLVARLTDTSQKVRTKAVETTLEVSDMNSCALSEMVAQCVASGSAWSSAGPPTPGGSADRSSKENDRSTGPRLQLLAQLVKKVHDRDSAGKWADETWKSLSEYAMKAAEHKNGDVRKEAAALLNCMTAAGGRAAEVAEHAISQLQALAEQKQKQKMRPNTSMRPITGSTARMGSSMGSRPGTGTQSNLGGTGRLSNLGSTGGFSLNMNSTGRLSTANRSRAGGTGASFRPGTGLSRTREMDEESDNSVRSEAPAVEAEGGPDGEGVQFFDVKKTLGGADEVPDLAEGEAALKDALPLAEALDEVALDFVAPLIALFGEGWTRCFYSRNWQCRVAALTHLSASMSQRVEEISGPEVSPAALGELLDGAMRAVHEGLGDQNVRVYAESCISVTAVVPTFCGAVDGRLLVAHLAPLLRQLCARMGDSKEVVRTQTTQAIFRLLNPPTGNIVSPVAICMLVLRHLTPAKDEGGCESPSSLTKGATGKGAATGWLCRLSALRDLAKEYTKNIVQHPGSTNPGEWLRLADGLRHSDPTVRHESARLYTLVCKMHSKSLGDEEAQRPCREVWAAALPQDIPPKSAAHVRKLLKLPESTDVQEESAGAASLNRSQKITSTTSCVPWEVPTNLSVWAGCEPQLLSVLAAPNKGDEKAVISALKALGKGVGKGEKAADRGGATTDEAFAGICRAIQQSIAYPTGADRYVFLCAIELCQMSITQLSSALSGLDINMGLGKTFPTLMERTALAGAAGDVKVGVASDKLVQQLAKHPKVGCEAVTKMVIGSISRTNRPVRPLVLLRTLMSDFGLRLCAQKDVVLLLLCAVAAQLERITSDKIQDGEEDADSVRAQLIGVLSTCNQFSPDTVHFCMSEVDGAQRKLLFAALAEAPNPRLVALGATAAEQETGALGGHLAGSAIRAASRNRDASPKPSPGSSPGPSPQPRGSPQSSASPGMSRKPPGPLPAVISRHNSRHQLQREDSGGLQRNGSSQKLAGEASPGVRDASPHSNSRRRRRSDERSPHATSKMEAAGGVSEASTAASTEFPSESPRQTKGFGGLSRRDGSRANLDNSMDSAGKSPWSGARPPAPMSLSSALNSKGGEHSWKFKGEGDDADSGGRHRLQRVGSSEARLMKNKEKSGNDSLEGIMDVLSQMDGGKTR
eukprot:TRINITY_DN18393_c0_g1_i1.p1 TRINITY_DN18393_c0_g1~~TRINITY_DN18393_c0_g1_i1.p1  ORF type:complete len:2224 (-),score=490.13 TRINITY_DN18393_c0_g1_i1:182-6853(-)